MTNAKYYFDTNICVFMFRKQFLFIEDKINEIGHENIKLPSVVKAELLAGAMKSKRKEENIRQVVDFCEAFELVSFDDSAAWEYGEIKSSLERKGIPIGYNDMMIAATVKAQQGILVTNDTREFSRIDGLMLEDWTQE